MKRARCFAAASDMANDALTPVHTLSERHEIDGRREVYKRIEADALMRSCLTEGRCSTVFARSALAHRKAWHEDGRVLAVAVSQP